MSLAQQHGNQARLEPPRRVLRSSTKQQSIRPSAATLTTPKTRPDVPHHRARATGRVKKRRAPTRWPTHFTCRICVDEKPADAFIKWIPNSHRRRTSSREVPRLCVMHLCQSPRKKQDPVCKACIGAWLSAQLDTLGARRVGNGCVEPGCKKEWAIDYIMKYLPVDVQEEYNIDMLRVWKEESEDYLLTCANDSCGAIGLLDHNRPGYPQVECAECQTRMCAVCKTSWHATSTCADQAARRVNEQMTNPELETLRLMQWRYAKRCPNCFLVVEKNGGCNSMYCIGCKKYFGWSTAPFAAPGTRPVSAFSRPGIPGYLERLSQWWHLYDPTVCEMDTIRAPQGAQRGGWLWGLKLWGWPTRQ